jgi:hypothetical protein
VTGGDAAFAGMAASPWGGLLVAIPYAILKLHRAPWLVVAIGVPLAYLQVMAVDLGWDLLLRAAWWRRLLERRRSKWFERVIASRGGFWITFGATMIAPWAVMAFARYGQLRQRHVALPIALALFCVGATVAAICVVAPRLI